VSREQVEIKFSHELPPEKKIITPGKSDWKPKDPVWLTEGQSILGVAVFELEVPDPVTYIILTAPRVTGKLGVCLEDGDLFLLHTEFGIERNLGNPSLGGNIYFTCTTSGLSLKQSTIHRRLLTRGIFQDPLRDMSGYLGNNETVCLYVDVGTSSEKEDKWLEVWKVVVSEKNGPWHINAEGLVEFAESLLDSNE
jgi:hypothetical protein